MLNFQIVRCFAVSFLALFLLAGCGESDLSTPIRTIAAWEPDAALMGDLSERSSHDFGSLQLPHDFKAINSQEKRGVVVYAFRGPANASGVQPVIQVSTKKLDSHQKPKNHGATLQKFIGAIQQSRTDWNASELERGTINGQEFVAQEWTGAARGVPMYGKMFVTYFDKTLFIASFQNSADGEDLRPLLETAIRTIQR